MISKKQKRINTTSKTNKKTDSKQQNSSFLKWPYYKLFITKHELQNLIIEMQQLEFTFTTEPYKPIAFNRRTSIIPAKFKGRYIKFVDNNYLKYDILPLIYSEEELLKCKFRTNPPALTYFEQNKLQLYSEFMKQNRPHTIPEYREFLFSKVKQCNNFRPTLALQSYNVLNINKSNTNKQAILDFSAGWGDRLFAACIGNRRYIGLDPNINNTHIYNTIIREHGNSTMQKVISTGAEYIAIPELKKHMHELDIKKFDLIFTSPPYFDYEIYSDTTQSISNFANNGFEKWLTYFLFNVIFRYVPLLNNNGYIGLYIQDTDNHNYLEPIGLFVLSFAKHMGLTVSGIISSTRFPFIVLQKVGTNHVYPYVNHENGKLFNKHTVTKLFKSKYPLLYVLCERLIKLHDNKLITPVLIGEDNNVSITNHYNNILNRTFEKIFMQLDINITTIIIDDIYIHSQPVKYFKQLLTKFKINLITISNFIQQQSHNSKYNEKNVCYITFVGLDNEQEYKQKQELQTKNIVTIDFKTILANTIDEWQLLNMHNKTSIKPVMTVSMLYEQLK